MAHPTREAAAITEAGRRTPLASPVEVAEYCQVTEETLRTWRYRKTGPRWSKVGKHVRYRWADVDAWIEKQAN